MKNRLGPLYCGWPNQANLKSNKGCRGQIIAIRQILEQCKVFKRMNNLIFIDFKAALDNVD